MPFDTLSDAPYGTHEQGKETDSKEGGSFVFAELLGQQQQ